MIVQFTTHAPMTRGAQQLYTGVADAAAGGDALDAATAANTAGAEAAAALEAQEPMLGGRLFESGGGADAARAAFALLGAATDAPVGADAPAVTLGALRALYEWGAGTDSSTGRLITAAAVREALAAMDALGGASPAIYDGALAVNGPVLVNGGGATMQLRGSSIPYSGSSINGANTGLFAGGGSWSTDTNVNTTGSATGVGIGMDLTKFGAWKMNCIRVPLNEASWLGYTCYDAAANGDGVVGVHAPTVKASNGSYVLNCNGTYRLQVDQLIVDVQSPQIAGKCYVLLDNHFSNPGRCAPQNQDMGANQDNSVQFWTSVAQRYGYPNGTELKRNGGLIDDRSVVFEIFNEPYLWSGADNGADPWSLLMDGGFMNSSYNSNSGGWGSVSVPWAPVYPFPCGTPTGTFIPGEPFTSTAPSGITGSIHCYYLNTTTGLQASGTKFIHLRGTVVAGVTGAIANMASIAAGTVIRGSISGATVMVSSPKYGWWVAGHRQQIAAIRATGAINPCLISGLAYASDLSQFATHYNAATMDTTPPAGFVAPPGWPGGSVWIPQTAATWHPYNTGMSCNAATVASGGSGYKVGDTITMPVYDTGPYANSVWGNDYGACPRISAILQVSTVSAGGAVTAVTVTNARNPNVSDTTGKNLYSPVGYAPNPIAQARTSGTGAGATFNLSYALFNTFANPGNFPTALAIKTVTPKIPIVITETGDYYSYVYPGLTGAPLFAFQSAWADANDIGMLPWSYNPPWPNMNGSGNFYIVGGDGKPTPGFGQAVYDWLQRRAPAPTVPAVTNANVPPSTLGLFAVSSYSSGLVGGQQSVNPLIYYPQSPGALMPIMAFVAGSAETYEARGTTQLQDFQQWGLLMASHGFAVIMVDAGIDGNTGPQSASLTQGIAIAKAENTRAGSPLFGLLDTASVCVMGHSIGGSGAFAVGGLGVAGLKACVGLTPVKQDDWSKTNVPCLQIGGQGDPFNTDAMYLSNMAALTAAPAKMFIEIVTEPIPPLLRSMHHVADTPLSTGPYGGNAYDHVIASVAVSFLKYWVLGFSGYNAYLVRDPVAMSAYSKSW